MRQARLLTHPDRSGATMNAMVPTINVDEHDVHESLERHTIFMFPFAATSTRGCRKDRLHAPPALYRCAMGSIETKAYRFCCTAFSMDWKRMRCPCICATSSLLRPDDFASQSR